MQIYDKWQKINDIIMNAHYEWNLLNGETLKMLFIATLQFEQDEVWCLHAG